MGAPKLETRPSVYSYQDYRAYLRDAFSYQKKTAGWSYRKFSEAAGFKSPNFLKLVVEGARNMTLLSVRKTVKAFRLTEDEAAFFKNLVFMNQAATSVERAQFAEQLYRSKVYRELRPLEPLQYDYYRSWYHVPIRELVARKDFNEDPAWIARQLRGKITTEDAARALGHLLELGLIRRDENGRLRPSEANVTTGHEAIGAAVASFHREMMARASEAIDDVPRAQREISGSTILLSEAAFTKLKGLVQEFRRSLLAQASAEGENLRVYQISFLLVPLTENEAENEAKKEEDR